MSGIDSFFDLVDGALGAIERVSSSPTSPASHLRPDEPAGRPAASSGTAISRRARAFCVVEAIDGATSRPSWVVTDGRDRADCSSAEFAERVRVALGG